MNTDRYECGRLSALQTINSNPSRENIISQAWTAQGDMEPDRFTEGWLEVCKEKLQELYGESLDLYGD